MHKFIELTTLETTLKFLNYYTKAFVKSILYYLLYRKQNKIISMARYLATYCSVEFSTYNAEHDKRLDFTFGYQQEMDLDRSSVQSKLLDKFKKLCKQCNYEFVVLNSLSSKQGERYSNPVYQIRIVHKEILKHEERRNYHHHNLGI
jgi:protein-arginine kinase activator protein McsA